MKPVSLIRTVVPTVAAAIWSLTALAAAGREAARPTVPLLNALQLAQYCDAKLQQAQQRIQALERPESAAPTKAADAKALLSAWNQLQIVLEDVQGPAELFSNVAPDPQVRTTAETCLLAVGQLSTGLLQNPAVYARFKAARAMEKSVDSVDKKMLRDVTNSFEDAGVGLPPIQRARMKAILARLDGLSQEFARNLRDNHQKLSFMPEEVKGLPEDYLSRAERDDQGNYLLGFDYPEFAPFMEYAENGEARKRYLIADTNRGTSRNLDLLSEAVTLRREMAALFGQTSYAQFVTRRNMAATPQAVQRFLEEVRAKVAALEKDELDELRALKADLNKQALAETKVESWDLSYLQQKLKRARFHIDQNGLRKYFPTDAAIPWILHVSGILYGIEFRAAPGPSWHADVRYYDVIDTHSHARIAGIYLDLFPREGKVGHAAVWEVRGSSSLAGRTPISVLIANFNRQGLDSEELETLLHEFGHVLHGVLSNTRYLGQANSSVERDFVEAPSQMYENWARNRETLSLMSRFCLSACPTLSDQQLEQIKSAHEFGRGILYGRQLLYAAYDMKLHGQTSGDPLQIWAEMEDATPLGHVPGTEFPGQFGHLMGGYAAAYYGYMWSEVLALDMLSRFHGKLLNPVVGQRYRKYVLSRGSELRAKDLVRNFLGREPDSTAFFEEISGRRPQ